MSMMLRVADPAGFAGSETVRPNPARRLLRWASAMLDRLAPPKRPGETEDLPPGWFKFPPAPF